MRALFLADLQLEGGGALGRGEYGEGSRFADQERALDHITALALGEGVNLVGVLGDVFDRARPSPWAVLAFQRFIRDLTREGIQVLSLLGNHDVKSAALPPALSIFKEDVHVALSPSLYPYEGVVVAALPWAPMSTLAARFEGKREDLYDHAIGALVHAAHFLSARCRDEFPGVPSVLVGHWAVSGAALPTGLTTDQLHEPIIPLDDVTSAGYSLAMFGHIHKPQVLSGSPPVAYCGSPYVINWGEAGFEHGVWLYDTAGELRFIPIPDRRFVTLDLDGGDVDKAGWADLDGAVVRVRTRLTEEEASEIPPGSVEQACRDLGATRVVFQPTITRTERARVESITEDLAPEEALSLWLDATDASDREMVLDVHREFIGRLS